jgi:hypothetical protein
MSHFLTGLKKVGQKRPKKAVKSMAERANGGPGGRVKIVDFIDFFVGKNQKSSRIVPFRDATQSTIANLVCERSEPCSRMTALGRWVQ